VDFFRGKVVLVVGASSGMGRLFAEQAAMRGALVAVVGRRATKVQELAAHIRGLALVADVSDEATAARVVEDTIEAYGRIDIVLLNVGGAPAIDLRTQTAADVKECMRLNYDVAVNVLMPCLAQMSQQRSGVVAVTSSLAGLLPLPEQGPYSAAKGALRLLIDTARLEYADRGITFVSLYPGFVATERVLSDDLDKSSMITTEQAVSEMLSAIAAGKHDHLFPRSTAAQVRVGMLAPARLRDAILRRRVAPDPG
jgi:NAD(P)-dependent dehydrogenase (short-subunit alcohol dehydrogenase family)